MVCLKRKHPSSFWVNEQFLNLYKLTYFHCMHTQSQTNGNVRMRSLSLKVEALVLEDIR